MVSVPVIVELFSMWIISFQCDVISITQTWRNIHDFLNYKLHKNERRDLWIMFSDAMSLKE